MNTTKKLMTLLLLMLSLSFIACSLEEPDGKWDKMKWVDVNDLMNDQGVYLLYQEGGSFTI